MSNEWKEESNTTGAEETPVEQHEAAVETRDEEAHEAEQEKRRRFWPFLLLLIIAAALFFQFAPQSLKEQYLTPLKQWIADLRTDMPKPGPAAPEPAGQAASQAVQPAAQPDAKQTIQPVEETAAETPLKTEAVVIEPEEEKVKPASSEEIDRVLGAMNSLQGELHALRQQQRELEERQRSVQIMQLRTRLRWIANPANHLPQLKLAWEEVSLMPVLSAAERQRAQEMLALAEKRLQELDHWQAILRTTAESLTRTEHRSVIPAFENRFLNWIAEQFSVRQSLSREEADDAQLHEQLLNTSRDIELERWPDERTWLQLRSTLQLRLIAAKDGSESSETALDLPESFADIRNDIDQLRQSAATWLEGL